jgi:hypothetical protein
MSYRRVERRTVRRRDKPVAPEAGDRRGNRRVFTRPVEPGAGQQPDCALVQTRVHPVTIEFDFVKPIRSLRCLVNELGELRFDPERQHCRFGATPSAE